MQVAIAGRKVVQCREVFEVAAVTAKQDLAQVDEAVDGLSEGGDLTRLVTIPMFHLSVVLEEGNVVGRRFQTQYPIEFVVHLDRYLAKMVLDAGALDARREAAAEFLRQLRRDPLAQEAGDLLSLDREDRLPGEFLVERLQDRVGTEHQIGRVFDLHQAPVIGLSEDLQDRAALLGVAIQKRMQGVGREGVRELLGSLPVADTEKRIVRHRVVDAGHVQRTRQPTVAIAIELQPKGAPRWHAQVDESENLVHPVEKSCRHLPAVWRRKVW